MITREEAKQIYLKGLDNEMVRNGKTLDDYAMMMPKKGKCAWTFREIREAVINDTALDDSGDYNPIDSTLRYYEWKEENKK